MAVIAPRGARGRTMTTPCLSGKNTAFLRIRVIVVF
jgi:hypothetical protein